MILVFCFQGTMNFVPLKSFHYCHLKRSITTIYSVDSPRVRVILILEESLVPGARYTLDGKNPIADKQNKHALDSSSSVAAALLGVH